MRGGSTVATSCIWPDNSGSELDAALLMSRFPARSVCLDSALDEAARGPQGGLVAVLRSHDQYRMFTHTALTQPPVFRGRTPRRRIQLVVHYAHVSRHGFLLFAHAPFFQYRKLWKVNCCSVWLNWSIWILIRKSFCLFIFYFLHFLVAGEGSSSIPRPLLRSSWRGWSIKPVTPPSSSSFFSSTNL